MIWSRDMVPEPLEEFHLVPAQLVRGEERTLVHAQTEQAPTLRIRQLVLLALSVKQMKL